MTTTLMRQHRFLSLMIVLIAVTLLSIPNISFARSLTLKEKLSDFHQLLSSIRSGYGPLAYKKELSIVDLDQLVPQYKSKIEQTQTNREFYYLLLQFVAQFQDTHFKITVPSDYKKSIPLTLDLIDSKVLITNIDREKLSLTATNSPSNFEVGDEIVAVNNHPVQEELQKLKSYLGKGYDLTATRMAAMYLTMRAAAIFPVPSEKEISFSIRRGHSNIIEDVTFTWIEEGTPLDESETWNTMSVKKGHLNNRNIDYKMLSLNNTDFTYLKKSDFRYHCKGTTRIDIPKGATIIMKEPFVAYYHYNVEAKGNVGYLRIPHYYPMNEISGQEEYEQRFLQYQYAVSLLEKNTVGLIIDQDHNCGGSVDFLHRIVGLFVDKPFTPLLFSLLATKESYLSFLRSIDDLPQSTIAREAMLKTADKIKETWRTDASSSALTPPMPIDGFDVIYPNYVHYTKPIIMLIDEMSGSGGDAFPSLMQGIGRAKLLGTRTMGAGGHVEEIASLNYSQIKIRITRSLFFRPDGVAVENHGAVPDIPYSPTRDDILYGFRPYQTFYLNELTKLL